jgi:hypothetical protein
MKKLILTCIALAAGASSAFAIGVDMNFNACAGVAGSSQTATIDCANGGALAGFVSFAPAEAITDLVALDSIVDIQITGGDVNTTANFWDFGHNVLAMTSLRNSTACSGYSSTWGTGGGNTNVGQVQSPTKVRMAWGSYRPAPAFNSLANQKLFGYSFTIDGSLSVLDTADGGTLNGCQLPAVIVVTQATPQSDNPATSNTTLTGPNLNPEPCVHVNGDVTTCGAVPAARHSWSQLKSLYR